MAKASDGKTPATLSRRDMLIKGTLAMGASTFVTTASSGAVGASATASGEPLSGLAALGEPFGAGMLELPEGSPLIRYARAYRRWFEEAPLPQYDGGPLYPRGPLPRAGSVIPSYSYTFEWNEPAYVQNHGSADLDTRVLLEQMKTLVFSEFGKVPLPPSPHYVGGGGYTHGIVNYGRVLAEGLDNYEHRLRDCSDPQFRDALLDLLAGVRVWHTRLLAEVQNAPATPARDRLAEALQRVPFQPARSFYEAVVAHNVVFYMDGCDNPGRIDSVLWPYLRDDATCSEPEAQALLEAFFDNVCANGWTAAIGGTDENGGPAYTKMTELCLRACHGKIRPSMELRVRDDMPAEIWDAAFDALASGNGQPAFYNEQGYRDAMQHAGLGVAESDFSLWCGGGCTETMIQGCSNVGSIDAGINLPLILSNTLDRLLTRDDITFQEVLDTYIEDARREIATVLDGLNTHFEARATHRPQPVRTLLMDDCIGRETEFNAGGARYNWSVINVAGVANAADSLAALREVVFEKRAVTPSQMHDVLVANFAGHELLRQQLVNCPKFGNDAAGVDDLAVRVAEFTYEAITGHPCKRGRFVPAHILFAVYDTAGQCVPATPDGRLGGDPLADSTGPVQGRDQSGPTAMLCSAGKLPQHMAAGTPVLNMRITAPSVNDTEARQRLRALVTSYFKMGGMQLQFTTLDREALRDAMLHPERHGDLVVRIGGFSAYFVHLPEALKREVLKRVEYAV